MVVRALFFHLCSFSSLFLLLAPYKRCHLFSWLGVAGVVLLPRFIVKYDGLSVVSACIILLADTGNLIVDRGTASIHLNLVVLFRFSVPGPTKLFLRIYKANAHSGHYIKEITPTLQP
jgi:hypothetical protein